MPFTCRLLAITTLVLVVAAATPASAHAPVAGLEGLAGGLPHILTEPAQALLLMSICLWRGQNGQRGKPLHHALIFLPFLVSGAASVFLFDIALSLVGVLSLGLACLLGLASAMRLELPEAAAQAIAAGVALLVGRLSMPDPGPLGAMIASGSGSLLGVFLAGAGLYLLTRWCASADRPQAMGIGLRVAGSWIAAAALMAGALALTRL